jgi:mRNA-degrading endonuclease toxin of MazEF toxin-antitoxin module
MTQSLVTGRIVWAELADANGIRKQRPAIIITPTDRIVPKGMIDVVAVTSRLSSPLPDDHVLLPWHPQRHPRTGLNRRCAAVCSWVARIASSDVQDVAGLVPGPIMLTILTRLANLLNPPSTSSAP